MAVFDNLNYTHSPGVAPSVIQYYERAVLPNMMPEMVHNRDAQRRTLPLNNGKTVQFRRITALPAITTPLVEGVTPAGQMMTETAFTAMVKPYGGHIEITDEYNWYLLGNKHREAAETLADQAALSLDTISRNALNAGMNVQFTGSCVKREDIAATDVLTYADIKKAVRTLRRANAKPFPDGFYHAIVHPDVVHDLTSDAMWVDVSKYQDKTKVEKYELGTIYKVKFYESTNAMVFIAKTYLFGTTANLAASGTTPWNATDRTLLFTDTNNLVTPDVARELTGQLVYVQYTSSGTAYNTLMCIESVDYANKRIKFRWAPDSTVTTNWKAANSCKIVPYGGGASGAPVYSTLVYAQNAYGSIELGGTGRNVRILIKPAGSSGALDPLDQRGTLGWRVNGFCTVILQDDFIVRIESGATA